MNDIATLQRQIEELSVENEILSEDLDSVRRMFAAEDVGWELLTGSIQSEEGMSLDQVKKVAKEIRERAVSAPLVKRGIGLRTSYVFSKGVFIPGINSVSTRRGRPGARAKFFSSPVNKRAFLSPEAWERLEKSASAEGICLLLGDEGTKELRPVPIDQIGAVYTNPDFIDEIWAYRREWSTIDSSGKSIKKKAWIFSDTYTGDLPDTIGEGHDRVPVDKRKRMIDQRFNSQTGWTFGVPDAVAATVWARIYTELLMDGKVMTEALARFAMKVTGVKSKRGSANIGAKIANGRGVGDTAALGEGQDLAPLSSAGRTYNFDGIRPIAAMVATALEVSIVHLLSDPGAAGSSYGSASNLDLPTKRAMVTRQNIWADYFERIVKWGTGEDIEVTFPPLDDPDPYREQQANLLAWSTGLVHSDEMRPRVMETAVIEPRHENAPEGFLYPNNQASAALDVSGATTQVSPDQGQSNNTGGVDSTLANS